MSFDGLSIEEEASQSAKIYHDSIDAYSYLDKRLDIDITSTHAWPIQ